MTRISTAVDVSSFTTDAKFRTWGSAVSVALAACGLVQTADTGQINWTTVVRPTVATTVAGYEVWRFNDTLQSSSPIFLKVYYRSGANASGQSPSLYMSAGTGSNGSGTLTGVQFGTTAEPNVGAGSTAASTNASMAMLFTHTTGYLLMYCDPTIVANPGSSAFHFAIDRTRDQSTGAPTAEGAYIWGSTYNSTALAKGNGQAVSFAIQQAFAVAPTSCMPPGDSANYGGSLFPVYACIPRPLVCVGMVGYMDVEIANYSTFTAKPIGTTTTRTYIALSNCGTSSLYGADAVAGVANEASVRTAFLWED